MLILRKYSAKNYVGQYFVKKYMKQGVKVQFVKRILKKKIKFCILYSNKITGIDKNCNF